MANQLGDTQMKLTKLLTGAAIAAIISGAASAQQIAIPGTLGAGGDFAASNDFMNELDLAAAGIAGDLALDLDLSTAGTGGTGLFNGLGAADVAQVEITLTNMEFSTGLNNSNFASGGTCALTIVDGGAAGQSSVTFETTGNPNTCDTAADDIQFLLPVEITGSDANISVNVTDDRPTPADLYSETYDSNQTLVGVQTLVVQAGPGIAVGFTPDGTPTEALIASASGVPFDNLTADDDLGDVTLTATGRLIDLGTAASLANALASVTMAVNFEDTTSFTGTGNGVTIGGTAVSFSGTTATRSAFAAAATTPVLANGDADNSGTAISAQDVGVTVTLNAPTGGSAVDGLSYSPVSGQLERIEREGTADTNSPFAWVGAAGSPTRNIFRCTGVATGAQAFVTVADSNNGTNGTYALPNTPSNGEMIITNDQIGAVAGSFGRADISFDFAGDASAPSCQRLLVGANGTLSELD